MTTTNKGLIQPANGSYVDTWDQPVNNDWSYIDAAFGGVTSLNATGVSAVTLTLTQYQPMAIAISGAMSNNVTYTIPSGVGGNWIVRNTTTDATGGPWTVTFASGGGGSTVTVIRSVNSNIWSDGTNMYFSDSRPAAAAGSNTQVQYNNSGLLGGANVYYIDSSGNVGIGTSSPGRKLDVIGDTSLAHQNSAQLLVRNLSGENCLDSYNDPITANYPLRFLGSYIRFLTSDAERMRIDSSGNVGIGTSSPAYKLDVPATVQFQGITIGANGTDIKSTTYGPITLQAQASGAGTNSFAAIYTSGSERMRIDSSGNVGIGTASPSQKLQVEGTIYSTSGGFQFPDNTTQTTAATGYTPPTAFSAIGTYAFLYYNGGIVASGGTVTSNGANLFPCDTNIANVSSIASGQVWQCMGYNGGYGAATLWLRTS